MADQAVEYAGEWLGKARHDWDSAKTLALHTPPLTDTAAFHCEQAVEKTLKAFLTYKANEFEKTHNVGRLCDLCAVEDTSFDALRERADRLSDYAIDPRYPGYDDPTLEDVQEALVIVNEVWRFVLDRLPVDLQNKFELD